MKRKGFTLIELLAVIVVLAIIALIATPIVMNTIKNAKKGAAERTADNYIKQVETTIAEKKLENNPLADGPYTIDENGNLTGNGLTESVTIDMNGNKPTSGTVTISNGGVSQNETTMTVGDYDVVYSNNKCTVVTIVYWRSSDGSVKIGDIMNDPTSYTKDPGTKRYYIKHVLDKDNKITESYACAILKGKEYCLRGGKDNNGNSFYGWSANASDYTENTLILKQIDDAKIEGISCSFSEDGSYCSDGNFKLIAYSSNVIAEDDSISGLFDCSISETGVSGCRMIGF